MMKPTYLTFIAATLLATAATADQPMDATQLGTLITGNTLYVTLPVGAPGAPEGGVAPIYYGADGSAAAQLPSGHKLIGSWAMAEAGYCIDWENGPKNSCSSLMRSDDSYHITDAATGDLRGEVFTIAFGNPERL